VPCWLAGWLLHPHSKKMLGCIIIINHHLSVMMMMMNPECSHSVFPKNTRLSLLE
jgi:hypothetical protein